MTKNEFLEKMDKVTELCFELLDEAPEEGEYSNVVDDFFAECANMINAIENLKDSYLLEKEEV